MATLPPIPSGSLTPWEKAIQARVLLLGSTVSGSSGSASGGVSAAALAAAVAALSAAIASGNSGLQTQINTVESTASSFGVGFGATATANSVLQGLTASTASFSTAPVVSTLTAVTELVTPMVTPSGVTPSTGQVLTALTASTMSWSDPFAGVTGSGTSGFIPIFTGSSTIGNSQLSQIITSSDTTIALNSNNDSIVQITSNIVGTAASLQLAAGTSYLYDLVQSGADVLTLASLNGVNAETILSYTPSAQVLNITSSNGMTASHLTVQDGTVSAPTITFGGTNWGFFFDNLNSGLGASVAGHEAMLITNSSALGVVMLGSDGAFSGLLGGNTLVGSGAQALGNNTTAIGWNAAATASNASAFGSGAAATLPHQIMLGTVSEFVVMPGTTNSVGTIVSGIWNGSAIGPTSGGTGLSSYTLGDTIYASAANVLSKLAGNITTARQFLSQTGTGAVSSAPVWAGLLAADIPVTLSATTFPSITLSSSLADVTISTFSADSQQGIAFLMPSAQPTLMLGTSISDCTMLVHLNTARIGLYDAFDNPTTLFIGSLQIASGIITGSNSNLGTISFPSVSTGQITFTPPVGVLTGPGFAFAAETAVPSWAQGKSANYTVLAADTGAVFNNAAAGGTVLTFSLPTAAKGLTFTFCDVLLTALSQIVLTPKSGDTIAFGTKTAGQSVSSPVAARASMKLSWGSANTWVVEFFTGSWT